MGYQAGGSGGVGWDSDGGRVMDDWGSSIIEVREVEGDGDMQLLGSGELYVDVEYCRGKRGIIVVVLSCCPGSL